jgi:chaperonin cofactor prefoldin
MSESAQVEQMWELQTRTTELRRHVVQLSSQLSAAAKDRDILTVTVSELDKLPSPTRTYRAVGKMFALADRATLRTDLEDSVAESKKRDEGRAALRDQFVGKLKDAEAQADQLAAVMQANPAFRKPIESK